MDWRWREPGKETKAARKREREQGAKKGDKDGLCLRVRKRERLVLRWKEQGARKGDKGGLFELATRLLVSIISYWQTVRMKQRLQRVRYFPVTLCLVSLSECTFLSMLQS